MEKVREEMRVELELPTLKLREEVKQEKKNIEEQRSELAADMKSFDEFKVTELSKEKEKLKRELREKIEKEVNSEVESLQTQVENQAAKLDDFRKKELELRTANQKLEEEKKEIDLTVARKVDEERAQIEKTLKKQLRSEVDDLHEQLEEQATRIEDFRNKELELRTAKQKLEEEKKDIGLTVARKVDEERSQIEKTLKKQLRSELEAPVLEKERQLEKEKRAIEKRKEALVIERESFDKLVADELAKKKAELEKSLREEIAGETGTELESLRTQVKDQSAKLGTFRKRELELIKKSSELEEEKKEVELSVARKLEKGRGRIEETAVKRVEEQRRIEKREYQKNMEDLTKQLEETRKRADRGSEQLHGELQELELEDILRAAFPEDDIDPVPAGRKGADVTQVVFSPSGKKCGLILWESKRTSNWSNAWIEKLKNDQLSAKASIGIIVTKTLPKSIESFGEIDGIWVTTWSSAIGLTTALRAGIIEVAHATASMEGKSQKMELLYMYLSGPEFGRKFSAALDTFVNMKAELDKEKRAMQRLWSKREKQMNGIFLNLSTIYGDMQGIVGASLPELPSLELKMIPEGEESGRRSTDNVDDLPL